MVTHSRLDQIHSADWKRTTAVRSVLSENRSILFRRWRIATSDDLYDPRLISRLFPKQEFLFDLLATLSEEDVRKLSESITPLFRVTYPKGMNPEFFHEDLSSTQLESESVAEVFMALLVRRDSLLSARAEASVLYGINPQEIAAITKFGPYELRALSRNPTMVIAPAVTNQFFVAATEHDLQEEERSVLAQVSRIQW